MIKTIFQAVILMVIFFYKGDRYHIYILPISEMGPWTQDKASVKILLSGSFKDGSKVTEHGNTKSSSGNTNVAQAILILYLLHVQ